MKELHFYRSAGSHYLLGGNSSRGGGKICCDSAAAGNQRNFCFVRWSHPDLVQMTKFDWNSDDVWTKNKNNGTGILVTRVNVS
jgi:hypothetical protein